MQDVTFGLQLFYSFLFGGSFVFDFFIWSLFMYFMYRKCEGMVPLAATAFRNPAHYSIGGKNGVAVGK